MWKVKVCGILLGCNDFIRENVDLLAKSVGLLFELFCLFLCQVELDLEGRNRVILGERIL